MGASGLGGSHSDEPGADAEAVETAKTPSRGRPLGMVSSRGESPGNIVQRKGTPKPHVISVRGCGLAIRLVAEYKVPQLEGFTRQGGKTRDGHVDD